MATLSTSAGKINTGFLTVTNELLDDMSSREIEDLLDLLKEEVVNIEYQLEDSEAGHGSEDERAWRAKARYAMKMRQLNIDRIGRYTSRLPSSSAA